MKRKLTIFMVTLCMVLLSAPLNDIKAEEYHRESDYILYTEKETMIGDIPLVGSPAIGEIPEGIYHSKERSNYFYKIEVNGGSHWVYKYEHVEVKEIRQLNNEILTLHENMKIYTEPFEVEKFELGVTAPAGEYKVSKKAFDWFFITNERYSGWVQVKEGKGSLRGTLSEYQDAHIPDISYKTQIIPYSVLRRPGFVTRPSSITIHNTANKTDGAGAQRHADLQSSTSNMRQSSWHFTVDDHEIIQSVPINEAAYHAGDGLSIGNGDSIAIEICENADGNFDQAVHNAAKLVANLLRDLNLTVNDVKKHKDWSGKECPRVMLDNNMWDAFIAEIQAEYDTLVPSTIIEGWVKKGDNWNYNMNGQAVHWWNAIGQDWYYFNEDGNQFTGWIYSGDVWYYCKVGGKMAKGWQMVDNAWYFLNRESGGMAKYWVKDNDQWYYLNDSGVMQKGWFYDGNNTFYLDNNGVMLIGSHTIEGVEYTFNENGYKL